MHKCKYCGQEFDNPYTLGGHTSRCKSNPNYKENCKKCCNYKGTKNLNTSEYFSKEINEKCKYCGQIFKTQNSLVQHECRCKENPNRIKAIGNKGNMPKHIKSYYNKNVVTRNGDKLDITNEELDKYKEEHIHCEICGKTIEEATQWKSKFAPKNLCVDHDHNTKKFRGLLCSVCNRQLGWYEKYQKEIEEYLNKNNII